MSAYRDEKLKSALQEAGAEFLKTAYDGPGLVTITGVRLENRGKKASILFTVMPEDNEEKALVCLKRLRSDFRRFVKDRTRIARPPKFYDFEIDLGEKNRQNIERLSTKL